MGEGEQGAGPTPATRLPCPLSGSPSTLHSLTQMSTVSGRQGVPSTTAAALSGVEVEAFC